MKERKWNIKATHVDDNDGVVVFMDFMWEQPVVSSINGGVPTCREDDVFLRTIFYFYFSFISLSTIGPIEELFSFHCYYYYFSLYTKKFFSTFNSFHLYTNNSMNVILFLFF